MRKPVLRGLAAAWLAGLILGLVCGVARADTVKLTAMLAPVSPTIKTGKGTAVLTLDTTAKTISWTMDYSDINTPAVAAFMVPGAKPSDNPTPLMITMPTTVASPLTGSMPLSDPQVAGIQSGSWWIMLGSKDGPEIGGEIKKAP